MKALLAAGAALSALAPSAQTIERITVTASPLARPEAELAQPATVLGEEELRRRRAANLGDTLAQEPGVQSSAFGAGAGRPIIRGLDGPRIRVLENGLGTGDVSSASPDHGVTAETLRAEQVEVLRGPASLLYGSGAIGGIVNVVSKTIPRSRPERLEGAVEARAASANRERSGSFDMNGGAGGVAWHLDAFRRRTRDYEIPGGRLGNSDVDSRGAAMGASYVGGRGFAGFGTQRLESNYGVPTGEGVRIDLRQERHEAAGEASLGGPFDRVRLRAARSDYRHDEVEASGEIGTRFRNRGSEGRLELRHAGPASGTLGLQWQDSEVSALGEEAILPRTRSRAAAVFVVGEKELRAWTIDGGLRLERERRRPQDGQPGRSFSLVTPALGAVVKLGAEHRLAIHATQAQRAPSVEELYTFGPHHATATFDIGDPALRKEVSRNLDLTLRRTAGEVRWKVNAYYNRIRDFVFAASEDADGDGVADRAEGQFLVQRYTQGRATFRGLEAEASLRRPGYGVRLFGDLLRAKLDSGGNLPRISPARLGLDADASLGPVTASVTAIRAFAQRRTAPLETPTPAHTRLDAEIAWRAETRPGRSVVVFLQGTNLLDEVIRLHTSYLKDVAPQMGRSATLGVRAEF